MHLLELLGALAHLGRPRCDGVVRLDRGCGPGRVFAVELDGERGPSTVVVKQFASPRTFAQEREALGGWLAGRDQLGGVAVPKLVAVDPARALLVMSHVSGTHDTHDTPAIHRAAGCFLAALHQLPVRDDDPLAIADALAQRHRTWLRGCEDALTLRERRVAIECTPQPETFVGAVRVPCHRDFTPDNWLWDGRRLAVVDFEHARLDLDLIDLAKLAVSVWPRAPDLAAAFFDGYGRLPTLADYTRLRTVVVLHGLASLAWGLSHGAPAFVDQGRRALALALVWHEPPWLLTTSP